ncbi:MAG TPA: J domain-containing protein [Mycobacteriales bacterium]|nr:J domain-containing protein [Mycobacteriales bacterium]
MDPAWAWRVLGLAPGATPAACRSAFRAAAPLLHPDRVADLSPDVRAEAHRRMVELAEAYRVCSALAAGRPAPAMRRAGDRQGALRPVGGLAAELLAEVESGLSSLATWDTYRAHLPTALDWTENAARSRAAAQLLEQIADAWPGTAEGDRARAMLVTSVAAVNSLSARERASHLVLVVDDEARRAAWDSLAGRDELAVAQVVYAHPTAAPAMRARARTRLVELDDWATLVDDSDADVRRTARARLLLQQFGPLRERAVWVDRRDRAEVSRDVAAWLKRAGDVHDGALAADLRAELDDAARTLAGAVPSTSRRA